MGAVLTETKKDAQGSAESLSWTVRLSDNAPHKRVAIWLAAVTAGLAGAVLLGQILLGILGFAIILAATADYWLGVTYKLTPENANRRCGLSISSIDWKDVKRVLVEGNEVRLSPLPEAGALDPFRGVALITTNENKERVLEEIRARVDEDVRFLG